MTSDVTKADLVELKSMSSPPQNVKNTLFSVGLLLGRLSAQEVKTPKDDRAWTIMRRVLGKHTGPESMIALMKAFDPKTVGPDELQRAKQFTEGLSEDSVAKCSTAAKKLLGWVKAAMAEVEQNSPQASG